MDILWSKILIYLSLGLYKGRPSYRRILQPLKETIRHRKTWHFLTLSIFMGHFCPGWIRIQFGSGTLYKCIVIFDKKIWLFCNWYNFKMFNHPGSGSAMIYNAGSGSAVKPMRTHNLDWSITCNWSIPKQKQGYQVRTVVQVLSEMREVKETGKL